MPRKARPPKPTVAPFAAVPSVVVHPGQRLRAEVLVPKKITVTDAAKLVGVGRPALSNFLNGNSAATPDMAARVERAFGVPAQQLLDWQAAFDAAQATAKGARRAMPYVPPFLGVKAADIETWVSRNIPARIRLAVLLRTLVHSTGANLTQVDFPGNDDAERPGWDGHIDAAQGNAWIPDGFSGWEFGVNQDVKGKADGDFEKSVKAVTAAERKRTTFVFVTPRNWPGKADWVTAKKAEGKWGDVRAYDSSDLEQWMEQSLPGQTWFANETLRASQGVRTLDRCWSDWADVASPPLNAALFAPAIDEAKRTMISRLSQPPGEPTVIAADSGEEALAFLAQLLGEAGGPELSKYRERVLVFDEPGTLTKLAQGSKDFIAVATNREVEREMGPLSHDLHTIVVYPRNATTADQHVVLQPLNYEAFRSALEAMGYDRDKVTRYAGESGRSPTVLRRRLSNVPAVRSPAWAADHATAASLVPFLLIGAWSSTNAADQTALTLLSNLNSYDLLEKECQRLAALNDAPLWSIGTYRGVISKIDLLFAIAGSITASDLKHYFELARIVLGEDDPKLDLAEKDRLAASIYGKSREFSGVLREGISETLVLLAVHGNHLFKARLGFDCEAEAAKLVRDLLEPLQTRILEANGRDLSAYAEAAPEEFLSILEKDLDSTEPASFGLMRPTGTDFFGDGCPRTGLLWALEGLAWNPETLPRVSLILARLAQIKIEDNWANKPISSLLSIFRAWMPQTAADQDARLAVLKMLAEKVPEVAWKICIEQLNVGQQTGHYSHKPRWRNDGNGFGEPVKHTSEIYSFMKITLDLVFGWKGGYNREMLCDLVQLLPDLADEDQAKVWSLIKAWADAGASDLNKAFVREKIRVSMLSRFGMRRTKSAKSAQLTEKARAARTALEPSDLLSKYEWMFRDHWVEESADELEEAEIDFRKTEERTANMRTAALREIYEARGTSGIFELAEMGKAATMIGWLMAERVLAEDDIPGFILAALPRASNGESWAKKNLVNGALRSMQDDKRRAAVLKKAKKQLSDADLVRLLLLAPFRRATWLMIDKLAEAYRQTYWKDVGPDWIHDSPDENNEAVERLLSAKRPRAAFATVRYKLEYLKPELLFHLMSDMVRHGDDQPGQYQLEHYYIERAFQLIDKDPGLTLDQKAGLEFAYIDALSQPWSKRETYGMPNLEAYVEKHPELFVQAVVWTYKRKDDGEDPAEWKVAPENIQHFAMRGYKLLDGLDRIPGHDDLGVLKADLLAAWVKSVRDACADLGRLAVADLSIGKLLSGAPVGKDGVWPCEPVREVMDQIHSKDIMRGAHTGLYNSRGVTWRGEGGAQERELADKYRAWANSLKYSHPYVSSELLMGMVRTYEQEANREDAEAGLRRRLR